MVNSNSEAQAQCAYLGQELDIFAEAQNWKQYWAKFIKPFLRGTLVEVGAGIGASTPHLVTPTVERLICLEPDNRFAAIIERDIQLGKLPRICSVSNDNLGICAL